MFVVFLPVRDAMIAFDIVDTVARVEFERWLVINDYSFLQMMIGDLIYQIYKRWIFKVIAICNC